MKPKVNQYNLYFLIIVSYFFLSINISLSPFNISFLNETFAVSKDSKTDDTKDIKTDDTKDTKTDDTKDIKTDDTKDTKTDDTKDTKTDDTKDIKAEKKRIKDEKKAEKKRIKDEKKAEKKRIKDEKKAEKAIAKKDKDKLLAELKIIFENNEISKIERDKKIKKIIDTYLEKIKIINSNYK